MFQSAFNKSVDWKIVTLCICYKEDVIRKNEISRNLAVSVAVEGWSVARIDDYERMKKEPHCHFLKTMADIFYHCRVANATL
jgi:hypothetical protein